jgi:RNA polymerase sigma factor (sigma-70 family)
VTPPGDEPSTDQLRRASAGDERAIAGLLAAYLGRLRAFVRLRSPPAVRRFESASDLVQSVCRELLAREARLDFASEPEFRAYLFTTALNKIRMRQRALDAQRRDPARARALHDDEALALEAGLASPSQVAQAAELAEQVERACDHLPENEREVLALARVAHLPTDVIASRLGKAESTVRHTLSRALVNLSRLLEAGDRPRPA